jgi:hypothetical protein
VSDLTTIDGPLAQRELEQAFAGEFERMFGVPLMGPDQAAGESGAERRLLAAERRELADREALAELLGLDAEDVI